jgi:2-polyprenyl-3-methyl-5-hydroxy-6-metoxy-1,4-benzoquinol methylase
MPEAIATNGLREQFGPIDIYLFDQLLRGRLARGMRVLDVGCGAGRNLVYLLREGYEVYGVDADARAVQEVRRLAAMLAPSIPEENFRLESIEQMSFPSEFADVVLSSAVFHFARDENHFGAMVRGAWRVLKPGGMMFCRLASSIGIEQLIQPMGHGQYLLPDGSTRFLVDEAMLVELTDKLGGELLDPLKTTVVQNQRSMSTWVVAKPA